MKKKIIKVLAAIAVFIAAASAVAYLACRREKEWLAFYIACCGGVLVVNLLLSMFFINKNFKDKS